MANTITLTSDAYLGRVFKFTVTQSGTSTTVDWTFEVTKMNSGNGTRADVSTINLTINGHSVYSYPATGWTQSTTFPVYYGSTSGTYDIGSYGTFTVILSGRPGYSTATSKSGQITLTQPAPSTNTITTTSIQNFLVGYEGDSFSLSTTPSGGSGYTYKWYRGGVAIGTSQTLNGTLTHDDYDNTYIYCLVTDQTGGTAATNKCQMRVGTSANKTQVFTHQVEPVRLYNGSQFLYGIPFVYNNEWKYSSWNITYNENNRADIAVAGNAIVG